MHLTRDDRVEGDNIIVGYGYVSLRSICLLSAQRMSDEETIKSRLAAGEVFDSVGAKQLFDAKRIRHNPHLASKTVGSRNNLSRRG